MFNIIHTVYRYSCGDIIPLGANVLSAFTFSVCVQNEALSKVAVE